jgi:tRNA (guanosine-2'-O-)-methyltransferase
MTSDLNRALQMKTSEIRQTKINRHDFKLISRNEIYVILDKINNGYNLGAILRLCDVTLVKKLYILDGKNAVARKALKASKGAENWVPHEIVNSAIEVIQKLKSEGVLIVSVEICHDSIDYRKLNFLDKPICFVFGNEMTGVSEEILNISDYRIHLPVQGMSNSLNVSSCASVILFEAIRETAIAK